MNVNLGCPAGFTSLCNMNASTALQGIISFLLILALIIAFFWLVLGGIKWIISGGDKNNVTAAREQVTQAIIGLVIVLVAWLILNIVGSMFGIQSVTNFTLPKLYQ